MDEALALDGILDTVMYNLEKYIRLDVPGDFHCVGVTGLAEAAIDQHYVISTTWEVNTADDLADTVAGLGNDTCFRGNFQKAMSKATGDIELEYLTIDSVSGLRGGTDCYWNTSDPVIFMAESNVRRRRLAEATTSAAASQCPL